MAPHGGLCSRFRARTFVRAHGRHAVKFSRRFRALGRHRGAFESAVSTRCSRGPRHLDTPPLAPPRGAPIVHAGRLGTVRANYRMYSHSLRHVSASDGPVRHPKRHRSTHAGLRDSLAAHRPPTRRSTSTQALARASPRRAVLRVQISATEARHAPALHLSRARPAAGMARRARLARCDRWSAARAAHQPRTHLSTGFRLSACTLASASHCCEAQHASVGIGLAYLFT